MEGNHVPNSLAHGCLPLGSEILFEDSQNILEEVSDSRNCRSWNLTESHHVPNSLNMVAIPQILRFILKILRTYEERFQIPRTDVPGIL